MDTELNIVVNAVNDSAAALEEVTTELEGIGVASTEMASAIDESNAEASASYAELNAGIAATATEMDELVASIGLGPAVAEYSAEVAALELDNDELAASFSESMAGIKGAALQLGIVALVAFQGFKDEIESATGAAITWDQTVAVLNRELQDTGSSMPVSELTDYAQQLSSSTDYTQQAILSAEALVVSHKDLQGSFKSTTQLAADLATYLAGGGTGDVSGAMQTLVKAMTDPQTAMRQLIGDGLDFSAVMVKTVDDLAQGGDTAGAAALIMGQLKDQFGGLSQAVAAAGGGPWQQFMADLAFMQKEIGDGLVPALDQAAQYLKPIVVEIGSWAEANPKLVAAILLIGASLSAFLVIVTGVALVIAAIGAAITALSSGPILIMIGAFAAVGAGLAVLTTGVVTNWNTIKTTITTIATEVMTFIQTWYNQIMSWVQNIANAMAGIGKSIGGAVSGTISSVENFIGVHDAVISPSGQIVSTDPKDYLIATQTPGSLLGTGGGNGGNAPIYVYITGTVQSSANQAITLGNQIAQIVNRQLKLQSTR